MKHVELVWQSYLNHNQETKDAITKKLEQLINRGYEIKTSACYYDAQHQQASIIYTLVKDDDKVS